VDAVDSVPPWEPSSSRILDSGLFALFFLTRVTLRRMPLFFDFGGGGGIEPSSEAFTPILRPIRLSGPPLFPDAELPLPSISG